MYFPHTPAEVEAMLRVIGTDSIEDLFQDVPAAHRFPDLNLPTALTEMEALAELQGLAWANDTAQDLICFPRGRCVQPLHSRRLSIHFSGGASSILPIHHTNRRSLRGRYRPFTTTRA